MKEKIEVLKKIADVLNKNNITWNLGASCMLYLRGIVDTFDDIDIMVKMDDINRVKELFKDYPLEEKYPNEQYKTEVFLEYKIENIDIDIMAGFNIVNNGKEHYFPLGDNVGDCFELDGASLYLETVETWLKYYKLMNREDKVKIIEEYLNKNKRIEKKPK
jgi:hypothetical protein